MNILLLVMIMVGCSNGSSYGDTVLPDVGVSQQIDRKIMSLMNGTAITRANLSLINDLMVKNVLQISNLSSQITNLLQTDYYYKDLSRNSDVQFWNVFIGLDSNWKYSFFIRWMLQKIFYYSTRKTLINSAASANIISLFLEQYQRNTVDYTSKFEPVWKYSILHSLNCIIWAGINYQGFTNRILHSYLHQIPLNQSPRLNQKFLYKFDAFTSHRLYSTYFFPTNNDYYDIIQLEWIGISEKEKYFERWLETKPVDFYADPALIFNLWMDQYFAEKDVTNYFRYYVTKGMYYLNKGIQANKINMESALFLLRICVKYQRYDYLVAIWNIDGVAELFDDRNIAGLISDIDLSPFNSALMFLKHNGGEQEVSNLLRILHDMKIKNMTKSANSNN